MSLSDTLQIDANMTVYERKQMKQARYGTPLALIRDRFILALGGFISRSQITKACECYDTYTNYWFTIASLPTQAANTTAVVLNERFVYVMPGSNSSASAGGQLLIN